MLGSSTDSSSGIDWDSSWVKTNSEVFGARLGQRPLVALESTLIAQGLPYPENLKTALQMEEGVRKEGAVPATIALWDGRIRVGLGKDQLKEIAQDDFSKAGVRDIPCCLAQGKSAATTVSATVRIASELGIAVMATGGIGGVHPGTGWDVSSDLTVLGESPVMVVCSGAKAILDLPATLEFLETLGIAVIGFRTKEFPAFLSRESGLNLDYFVENARQAAEIFRVSRELGRTGLLLVNPPPEDYAIPHEELHEWVERAQEKARVEGIKGKRLTPFLLGQIQQTSGGRAEKANRALAVSNARLAARVAVGMASGE